jgi:hypothetical protein
MSRPERYDHVRPGDANIPDGVYRVVGHDEATVTLLRVGDGNGRRLNTGDVRTLSREEFATCDSAENPDGNRPRGERLTSTVEMSYWSLRAFGQQLASNLLATGAALTLVLVGVYGEQVLTLPDIVFGGLIVIGSLGLAYVGGGRLRS